MKTEPLAPTLSQMREAQDGVEAAPQGACAVPRPLPQQQRLHRAHRGLPGGQRVWLTCTGTEARHFPYILPTMTYKMRLI